MGTRVRKVIGYGFDDLTIEEGQYELHHDTRFNPDGYFCVDWEDRDTNFPMDEFQIQLKIMAHNKKDWDSVNYALLDQTIQDGGFTDFQDLIAFEPEFGLSNTCVFVPPGCSERWCENDRQVDYYDETVRNRQVGHVLPIDRPLYPYEGWVDLRNDPPTRVTGITESLHSQGRFAHLNTDSFDLQMQFRKIAMEKLEFTSWFDLENTIVPIIPPELIVALTYLKVFNDPSTVHRLKPMIYTFWS